MVFDIHSHLIPKIDDGARSIAESQRMLQVLKGEGVDKLLATPHFYPERDVLADFLRTREASLNGLLSACDSSDIPEIFLGCELYYLPGMSKFEGLSQLKIGSSRYILIELPYGGIDTGVLEDIFNFSVNFSLVPVFAHLERFGLFKGFKKTVEFVESCNALAQVNTSSFFDRRLKKYAVMLAKKDLISFLGSDLHSPHGKPMFKNALTFLENRFPGSYRRVNACSEALYSQLTLSSVPLKTD